MDDSLLRSWRPVGTPGDDILTNSAGSTLVNGVALVAACIIALQAPLVWLYWPAQVGVKTTLISVMLMVLLHVPRLNAGKQHGKARILLVSSYWMYLNGTIWLWHSNLYFHYFLLLGAAICPFLYPSTEERRLWLSVTLYILTYLFYELVKFGVMADNAAPSSTQEQFMAMVRGCNVISLCAGLVICSAYLRTVIQRYRTSLFKKHHATATLLHHTLPAHVATQLICKPDQIVAQYYANVSVVFADIAGFSGICKKYPPQQLVSLLNTLFALFDQCMIKFNIEKIKTNGDQYIAVAGLQSGNDNAGRSCQAALEIRAIFNQFERRLRLNSAIRIGIATGPVVAGVIGRQKYSFDVWGETVNFASRLESQGKKNQIQVNQRTFLQARHIFPFQLRDEVEFKGIGKQKSYWLGSETE